MAYHGTELLDLPADPSWFVGRGKWHYQKGKICSTPKISKNYGLHGSTLSDYTDTFSQSKTWELCIQTEGMLVPNHLLKAENIYGKFFLLMGILLLTTIATLTILLVSSSQYSIESNPTYLHTVTSLITWSRAISTVFIVSIFQSDVYDIPSRARTT